MELVKERILKFVNDNPSTHLQKIKTSLGCSMGTTQYHLHRLEKEGKIFSKRNGFYKNYYTVGETQDLELMSILNLESPRKIILYLLQNEPCTHKQIADGVGLSSSTVSWHMKSLVTAEIVSLQYDGKFSVYSLKNKEKVLPLLARYRSSTWNDMLSNMTEIFSAFQQ